MTLHTQLFIQELLDILTGSWKQLLQTVVCEDYVVVKKMVKVV